MMQRPGCFVYVVLAVFAVLAVFVNWANGQQTVSEASPLGTADMQPSVGLTPEGTPSATVPPTVDGLATDAASLAATSAVVGTMRAGTETQRIQGTVEARTATAEAWTATAIAGAATLRSAEITAVIAEVNILAETLTAVPPQRTADAVREWHTQNAINTEIAVRATNDTREVTQAEQWDGALHLSGVVLLGVVTLLVPVGLLSMIGAAAWRVKGEAGGKGQAAVEAVRRIPTDGGDLRAEVQRLTEALNATSADRDRMAQQLGMAQSEARGLRIELQRLSAPNGGVA